MRDGELLLVDAATSFDHYSADVTRTIPVNGHFSRSSATSTRSSATRRRRSSARSSRASASDGRERFGPGGGRQGPGPAGPDRGGRRDPGPGAGDEAARRRAAPERALRRCTATGATASGSRCTTRRSTTRAGTSSRRGTCSRWSRASTSAPTCWQPARHARRTGLCWPRSARRPEKYQGIGVRIEDDYALTDAGLEWLSSGAPREIPEIESLMRAAGARAAGRRRLRQAAHLTRGGRRSVPAWRGAERAHEIVGRPRR